MSRRFLRSGGGGGSGSSVASMGGFAFHASNVSGLRPSSVYGTAVTPNQNAKGAWTALLAAGSVTQNIYGIRIGLSNTAVGGQSKNCLVDIGVDTAGGTSYSVLIPDLFAAQLPGVSAGPLLWYYFPVYAPSGSSFAARASVNNATVGSVRVIIDVLGSPLSGATKAGTTVTAYGVTAASSSGTAVTPGQAAEGAWTSIGTLSADSWFFQMGIGIDNATQTGAFQSWDLAEGDGNTVLIRDLLMANTSGETSNFFGNETYLLNQQSIASGATIKARGQSSGVPDTGFSVIAYAVSGTA